MRWYDVRLKDVLHGLPCMSRCQDFATIILFNSAIEAQYTASLVPMSDAERATAKRWLDLQQWESGGTNFQTALNRAFTVIESSVSGGSTSMCQKAGC